MFTASVSAVAVELVLDVLEMHQEVLLVQMVAELEVTLGPVDVPAAVAVAVAGQDFIKDQLIM